MFKTLIVIFFLSFSLHAENLLIEMQKERILTSIDNYTFTEFVEIYGNVVEKLKEEGNYNAMNRITERETIKLLAYNYKDMLKTIASNESSFAHTVGLYDKNDLSYFQINVGNSIWNLSKLNHLTKMNVSRERLINDHVFAGKVALHILIYNIAIHSNYFKYSPTKDDLLKLIATYNNPINLDPLYIKKAKTFLASL